jgi:DeoR family transcriptional regulator, fructose operon transcriptional repressor
MPCFPDSHRIHSEVNGSMLVEERQALILEKLRENQSIRISELCSMLSVSRETIRKDLYQLEKKGLLKKVHGGAVLDKTNVEPPYVTRQMSHVREKEAIARKAAELVDDGDALFIDLGTTTLLFAKQLKAKKGLTVITNSLPVAMELAGSPEIKVLLPGGELRPGELALSGPITRQSLNNFYVDKTFIGVGGLAWDSGVTDYHIQEADIRKQMLERGGMKIALADHSKFNVTALAKVAELKDLDVVVTDDRAPREFLDKLAELDVEILVAPVQHASKEEKS